MDKTVNVLPLFSSPIAIMQLPKLTEKEFNFVLNIDYERMFSNNGFYSINKYILNSLELIECKRKILDHLQIYVRDILKISSDISFKLTNSWIVKNIPEDYASGHIHENSLISGVLYLKVPQDSGNIVFHREFFPFTRLISLKYTERNLFNCDSYSLTPKEGLLLFFPSIVGHSITKNISDQNRYSLSFNFFPTGKFGSEDSALTIE